MKRGRKTGKFFGKASPGDKIRIRTEEGFFGGTLLESYDPSTLLIKLESGYNVGIAIEKIKRLEVVEKYKPLKEKEKIEEGKVKKCVALVVTGGTISSRLDYVTGGVKWLTKPHQLLEICPKISDIASIIIESPFMLASENMCSREWIELAKLSARLLNKKEIKGVIITHGTDTLHYTASALAFMLGKLNKPVVLTFAQRSSDRGSTDAALNLFCATKAALSDIAEVMLVGHASSNDDFCYAMPACKTRKMHTSARAAFKCINSSPIAKISEDSFEILKKDYNRRNEIQVRADAVFDEKTALLKFYPGMKAEEIEFFIEKGYHGLVIEASGLGHVATSEAKHNLLPVIKKAIKKDMIVCFAPQTLYGRLDPYVYSPGRELLQAGVIFLQDMLPETAYVKLGWLLGHNYKKEKVCELMQRNFAGEINPRLNDKNFL